jgi:acetyl esterase/lipase
MTPRTAVDLGMPPEVAAELRTIGARIETQRTGELYAALQPKEPYAWLEVTRDRKYGPHERNVLDVFKAPGSSAVAKPVVVFVHGGGFARGAKRMEGLPFYDNIGLWAVGQELVGVTLSYRLAPQSTWPAGIEDLTAAVAWLKANVARYGGRPPSDQPEQGMDLGESGAPSEATSTKGFQIYVPLQGEEKAPEGGDAGKASEKARKG